MLYNDDILKVLVIKFKIRQVLIRYSLRIAHYMADFLYNIHGYLSWSMTNKQQNSLYTKQRFRSAWALAQSDQSFCAAVCMKEGWVVSYP